MPNVPRSSGLVVISTRADSNVRAVHYGICLANIGTYSDPRAAVRVAEAAEQSSWEGIFVWDHLAFAWGPPAADPWIVLAAIASSTERLLIGTAVTPVARRRPHVLANQVATLDVLSGGRVIFGAGLGGSSSEFGKFGEPTDAKVRAAMLDEALELLRRLWSGQEVTHNGEHYMVDGVTLAPTPVQERLPIWIGGNKPPSQGRAARWDGWMPDSTYPPGAGATPERVGEGLARIGELSEDPERRFDVAVIAEQGVSEPRAYEQAGATWWLESVQDRRGSPEEMLALVNSGPPG
jgi:alkanesulfonate monooxygenase SsuD/methylene tetrahydromethanopterin reductase-like flavin-dependent oxidoreductase (luciferase family)